MKSHLRRLVLAASFAGMPGFACAADDWQARVGEAIGKAGVVAPGSIYRIGLPRTDLTVTLDGVALKPGFAPGGWLAFKKNGDDGIAMGDLVPTEGEVAPVMAKLAAFGIPVTALHNHLLRNQPFTHGIEVTAIHNHMLDDQPHLSFLHFWGNDDAVKFAQGLKAALAQNNIARS